MGMQSRSGGTSSSATGSTVFTSESVTEGHPDKACDQISDAVLDAALAVDSGARVACEAAISDGLILVFGELSPSPGHDGLAFRQSLAIPEVARGVVRRIGYTQAAHGIDPATSEVRNAVKGQSQEIAAAV